ncbi:MAG TPA: hypothetical protein VEN82_07245 [Actinomycetota bacterium]|nr:hypothetical protein [Actinomycetota bacterium]
MGPVGITLEGSGDSVPALVGEWPDRAEVTVEVFHRSPWMFYRPGAARLIEIRLANAHAIYRLLGSRKGRPDIMILGLLYHEP